MQVSSNAPFKRGAYDVFKITGTGIGPVRRVRIGHDNTGSGYVTSVGNIWVRGFLYGILR